MKMIIAVALALVAVAVAAPTEPIQIVRSQFEKQPDGAYVYSFENSDGTSRVENGELKEALDEDNKPHTVIVTRGSYTYLNEEGKPLTVTYFADETGYHAEGDSIPKPVSRR